MSKQNPETLKGGHGPEEVWVTHKLVGIEDHFMYDASEKPWDQDYLNIAPPITTYASNERYVRGDLFENMKARAEAAESRLNEVTTNVIQADTFAKKIEAAAKVGYNVCAETRHVTLGLAVEKAIRDLSPTPQADPVREAATERMIDAAFNALPPDAHGTIGSGEMYRVIEAALAQKDQN